MVSNIGQFHPEDYPDPESLSLRDRQKLLCQLLPKLLNHIYAQGYSATLGDAYRDKRVHGAYGEFALSLTFKFLEACLSVIPGALADQARSALGEIRKARYSARKSLHKLRLAIDLNLFDSHGRYLQDTPEYAFAGQFWMSLHPLCEWGGAGERNDGNHFSVRWEGRW